MTKRLTPKEGEELFRTAPLPEYLLHYDPDLHLEDMKCLATGLIGAMLLLGLPSLSGPQLGSPIPLVVTMVGRDYLRIFVDPEIKKSGDHILVTAFSYLGHRQIFDTEEVPYTPWREFVDEMLLQEAVLKSIPRDPSVRVDENATSYSVPRVSHSQSKLPI